MGEDGATFSVDRATINRAGDVVVFDDAQCGWAVRLRTAQRGGRRVVTQLRVDVRRGGAEVTGARLARLPLRRLLTAAAAHDHTTPAANETFYRMLAWPRPAGQRHWDVGHWERVRTVYEWARAVGRAGGPVRAVAEFWGVAVNPTAYRWLAIARVNRRQ